MITSFNDFIRKYSLEIKAILNIKLLRILSSLYLNDVGIFLRDGPFKSDVRIVNLHPTKITHWVAYINQRFLDLCGCSPLQKLSRFIIERNGQCLYSENKSQGLDSYCAAYCLYFIYLTKPFGRYSKSAVLNLYYQRFFSYRNDVTENNN